MRNLIILTLLSAFTVTTLIAQNVGSSLIKKHYNLEKDLALNGYDAVSYFNGNKPQKGKSNIQVTSEGATYYFSNEKNKATFLQNPDKYKPQYGGWCAYAMGASGEKVEVDPNTYKLINGKLYLFYNAFFNNTLTTWNKNESELKNKADSNWKKIYK
ncbi:MAG: YHS domain-containing protein [Bacteroidetes bacterium]|nr:YHS domain-containing protein [Bacteroidota bacterium]